MNETNLRSVDVEFFQYAALPTIIMLLLIGGLITGGLSMAREFEDETIKELLLSPVSSAAIVTGKVWQASSPVSAWASSSWRG